MRKRNRLFLLAAFAVAILVSAIGCNRQQVSGQNAMPENPSLSPGDNRKAMIQYHQQHDKQPDGATEQTKN